MTFEMFTVAFGESTISKTQIQLWYIRFMEGREGINSDARPSHSSTFINYESIEAVKKMILDGFDLTITIRELIRWHTV